MTYYIISPHKDIYSKNFVILNNMTKLEDFGMWHCYVKNNYGDSFTVFANILLIGK